MELCFLQRAIELASENVARGGGPFGCVIVRAGQIIAAEANQVTPPHDPTAHAEVQAIRAACAALKSHQLDGCDLYASCEPCPMCLGAIYWARPRAVYFAASRHDAARAGFDDELIYRELNRPPAERRIAMKHYPVDEADAPFARWIALENRRTY
ncbi:MAG TPA: nucleoside deaminase [Tepidisphaeraceae bacterium]|nr:nucleoside deaminase [Tepidisphaeraceae bacterium]